MINVTLSLSEINDNINISRFRVGYNPKTLIAVFNGWITVVEEIPTNTKIFNLPYKNAYTNPYYIIMLKAESGFELHAAEIVSSGYEVKTDMKLTKGSYCTLGCALLK